MTIDLLPEWASGGAKENPETTEVGKIALGWLPSERPPMEWENYICNQRDVKINEIATSINTGVSLNKLLAGVMTVERNAGIYAYTSVIQADGSANGINYRKESISNDIYEFTNFSHGGLGMQENNYDNENVNLQINSKGLQFGGTRHPNSSGMAPPIYNFSMLDLNGWSSSFFQSGTNGFWTANDYVDTNIPIACKIIGGNVSYETALGIVICAPVKFKLDPSGGVTWSAQMTINTTDAIFTTNMILTIFFDGTYL